MSTERLFEWRQLTPHAWVVFGNGANSVVLASGSDVLLVDTKETGYGGALRREVEQVIGRAVTRVVSTHHHTDHAMGNDAFTRDVPVLAQRRAHARTIARVTRALAEAVGEQEAGRDPRVAFEADLHAWAAYYGVVRTSEATRVSYRSLVDEARTARAAHRAELVDEAYSAIAARFAPTELFDQAHELRVGDLSVELHHFGPAHTDNDVCLLVPSEGLVVVADLVYVGLHPFIDVGSGASTISWQRSLDALSSECRLMGGARELIVVPGHGPPAGIAELARQHAYFDVLRSAVEPAVRAEMSREEAVTTVPHGLPVEMDALLPVNLGVVYDELTHS